MSDNKKVSQEEDFSVKSADKAADEAAIKIEVNENGKEVLGDDQPVEGKNEPVREKKVRSRGRLMSSSGIAHIKSTFNNTLVSITDMNGGVIAWSNAGRAGFKGSRKSTAFAATLVGQDVGRQAVGMGLREVEARVQGAGSGRESAIRALQSAGLTIRVIKDVTPIAHNGCRPRKRRRV